MILKANLTFSTLRLLKSEIFLFNFQVKSILGEYKIHNADVVLRYDATADDLIDVVEGNRIYIPCIYLLNKIDQISVEELDIVSEMPHCVPISAHHKWNYDSLLEKVCTQHLSYILLESDIKLINKN